MPFVRNDQSSLASASTSQLLLPWVTVICTSYNQQAFVAQALQSVIAQSYPNIELIVIDNGSTDQTATRIHEVIQPYPAIRFIHNTLNLGLNRAFNQGLALAKGQYIIDLSADDVLLPDRITRQVVFFEQLPDEYGVVFSNATYIDASGNVTGVHYPIDPATGLARTVVPTGYVFRQILTGYFICTPTMMMRRRVLNQLNGYDEALSYEDFDFWVRSSRFCRYAYLDAVLTRKRRHSNAMSAQVTQPQNDLLPSTLLVCRKALALCETPAERLALALRLQKFIRKAFYAEQFDVALQFGDLIRQFAHPDLLTSAVLAMSSLRVPVNRLYRHYRQWPFVRKSAKLV
jgi:glycosyltransferase involved in cell wall biosynthesis